MRAEPRKPATRRPRRARATGRSRKRYFSSRKPPKAMAAARVQLAFVAVTTDTELGVATPVIVSGAGGGLLPPGGFGEFAAVPLPPPPHPAKRQRKSAAATAARIETCFTYTPLAGEKSPRDRSTASAGRTAGFNSRCTKEDTAHAPPTLCRQRRESGSAVVSLMVESAIEEWTDSTPGIFER